MLLNGAPEGDRDDFIGEDNRRCYELSVAFIERQSSLCCNIYTRKVPLIPPKSPNRHRKIVHYVGRTGRSVCTGLKAMVSAGRSADEKKSRHNALHRKMKMRWSVAGAD
jgi:hypothetical protein